MANTAYQQVLSAAGNVSRSALIQMLEQRSVYVIEGSEDPQDLTPGFATHLAFHGVVFWYDAADATTAHDGTSCLVTADGKRFKADGLEGAQRRHWAVKDKDLTAPPVSPAAGDIYIVAAGGSGAWSGKDKKIAVYTARGWLFITPAAFDIATVIDESLIYHYSAGGAWTSGIGALSIGANAVYPTAIKYARWGLSVVNQTTNAPPGSPTDGDSYIIGGSPTGAWSGKARQIAIYQDSAWAYYVPVEGDHAYDRNLNAEYVYDGSAWASQISGYSNVKASGRLDAGGNISGSYSYSTTAPTTSNMTLQVSFDYTPRKAGATVEVDVFIGDVVLSTSSITNDYAHAQTNVGFFVDSDANATDWGRGPACAAYATAGGATINQSASFRGTFIWTAPDTSLHTLKIYGSFINGRNMSSTMRFNDVRIVVRELA